MDPLPKCEYFESHPTTTDTATEVAHIDMKIGILDNHIRQLTELRRDLHYRSLQLQNSCSPIYTLPAEVLSTIFLLAAGSVTDIFSSRPLVERHQANLRQSITLSAVTTHFRRVAFNTVDLWKTVPVVFTRLSCVADARALLRHCFALTPYINIVVQDLLRERDVPFAADILSLSGVTSKVKSFEVYSTTMKHWIASLRRGFFPILDSVSLRPDIGFGELLAKRYSSFDLGSLTSIVRLRIYCFYPCLTLPVVIPPSIQVLHLTNVPEDVKISLLYQCPNLVKCDIDGYTSAGRVWLSEAPSLTRLKRFVWDVGPYTREPIQNLHMPSLEYLELKLSNGGFETVHSLCHHLSQTLTTLVLTNLPDTFGIGHLRQLFRISFPKLETLEIHYFHNIELMRNVFLALVPRGEESEALLNLKKLVLLCDGEITVHPPLLLDLLQNWKVDETSCFCVEVKSYGDVLEDWPPYLLKELRSIVEGRQIEVTWGNRKLLQC
jgi:hypothetical protein